VLLGIRAFRYRRFLVEALLGIGAFGYTRLWVVTPSWALGHLGTWALGHLGTWALGHLGSWALGLLGTWAPGHLGSWAAAASGDLGGRSLNLGSWALGLLGTWALGLLGTWAQHCLEPGVILHYMHARLLGKAAGQGCMQWFHAMVQYGICCKRSCGANTAMGTPTKLEFILPASHPGA
jgi:hypothetical protein